MKVYLVVPKEEFYDSSTTIYVCTNRADAEEMVFSLVEEAQYESFCWACVDNEEDFHCESEFILPWEDDKFINCNHCENYQCKTVNELLRFCHNYYYFNSWEIIESEVI